MCKFFKLFFICSISLLCTSCDYGLHEFLARKDSVDMRTSTIKTLETLDIKDEFNAPLDSYSILLLADVHEGAKYEVLLQKLLTTIQDMYPKPKFCVVLGDVVEHGYESEYKSFQTLQNGIKALSIPIYTIPGNHDIYNSGWTHFKNYVKPSYGAFCFSVGNYECYFLDSANGTFGRSQMRDLKQKFSISSKPKLVFSHYPLGDKKISYFVIADPRERSFTIDLFSRSNVKNYFSGHYHPGNITDYGLFKDITLKAFGHYKTYYLLEVSGATAQSPEFFLKEMKLE